MAVRQNDIRTARRFMDVSQQIEQLKAQALAELREVKDAAALEQYRIKYLGSNGRLKAAMKLLGQVPKEQKPAMGQQLNATKEAVSAAFEARKAQLALASVSADAIDLTAAGRAPQSGA